MSAPTQIALLLPSIRAARECRARPFATVSSLRSITRHRRREVRVYDTNGASIGAVYEQAGADGAQLVIGPLDKQSVVDINLLPYRRVPVLALNYLPQGVTAGAGLFQFGLAIEDEAHAIARRVYEDGFPRVAIVQSDLDWSARASRIVPHPVRPTRRDGCHGRHDSRRARRHRSGRQRAARRRQHRTYGSAFEDAGIQARVHGATPFRPRCARCADRSGSSTRAELGDGIPFRGRRADLCHVASHDQCLIERSRRSQRLSHHRTAVAGVSERDPHRSRIGVRQFANVAVAPLRARCRCVSIERSRRSAHPEFTRSAVWAKRGNCRSAAPAWSRANRPGHSCNMARWWPCLPWRPDANRGRMGSPRRARRRERT